MCYTDKCILLFEIFWRFVYFYIIILRILCNRRNICYSCIIFAGFLLSITPYYGIETKLEKTKNYIIMILIWWVKTCRVNDTH